MLPIDMYTGHADLSPRNCDKQVLSDDRIIGAIVAPLGKAFLIRGQSIFVLLPLEFLTCVSPHQSAVHISLITLYCPAASAYALAGEYAISSLNKGLPISSLTHSKGSRLQSSMSSCNGTPFSSSWLPRTVTFLQLQSGPCGSWSTLCKNERLL